MNQTIGIVGGCGPLATVDIEYKLLKAMQEILNPILDQDYLNLLVFNYTQFYDRNDSIIFNQNSPLSAYTNCIKDLILLGADILLIACQTAHTYVNEMQKGTNVPIVDMVYETAKHISEISPKLFKVGLLSTEATKKKELYQNALFPYDIEVVKLYQNIQSKLMEAIYIIKSGVDLTSNKTKIINNCYSMLDMDSKRYNEIKSHPYKKILLQQYLPNPLVIIKEAIIFLKSHGCKHIILGCTELPLILQYIDINEMKINFIDPNTIVSRSIVYMAKKLRPKKLKYIN